MNRPLQPSGPGPEPSSTARSAGTHETGGGPLRILSVEDSAIDAELCWRELGRAGLQFVTQRVWAREDFERALQEFSPDLILCDFSLPGAFDGLTALDVMRAKSMDTPFIFVSGTIGEERAVEALKRGATDYVLKERLERLAPVAKRALQEARERAALRHAQEALRDSEERFRQLAENIRDVFFLIDAADQRVLYVSPAYEEIWGESRAGLYANPDGWTEFIHPEDRPRVIDSRARMLQGHWTDCEYRIVRWDGSIRWIGERAFPIVDDSGRLRRIAGVASDITVRKKAEERIGRLNRIYAVLSGINTLIVRAADRDELLREACRIAIDPGRFRAAWIGLRGDGGRAVTPVAYAGDIEGLLDDALPASTGTPADVHHLVAQVLDSGRPAVLNDIRGGARQRSRTRGLEAHGIGSLAIMPLHVGGTTVGVLALYATEPSVFDDDELRLITELAGDIAFALDYLAKGEKLSYLAYYDALTGLPNRTLFTERLNHRLRVARHNGTKVAVVLCDVKRFRLVNESFGRPAGDALLREVADRTSRNWPSPDSVARINADCFGGTLTDFQDEATVAHAVERALKAMTEEPCSVGEKDLRISTTAGIALFPADGGDADTLFGNAEAALKKAKASGDRYLFYQPSMNARVADILLLENRLRRAVEREEFVLYYQPKLNLATESISGLEALIRWKDPDNGIVAPGTFIPLLEETGMILTVGAWAVRRALSDHREWRRQGLQPPRIAVNVSAVQLRKADFVASARAAVAGSGAESHGLDLEITESLIMEDIEDNIGKLEALRGMNIRIAIDDFGTGYSSLSYLARLPVEFLKIDRSFIITMVDHPDSMTIVSTIISLAHSLNLKVIAEGVETEEQARMLKRLECDEVQGYLFGRPMPFEGITALLARGPGGPGRPGH